MPFSAIQLKWVLKLGFQQIITFIFFVMLLLIQTPNQKLYMKKAAGL